MKIKIRSLCLIISLVLFSVLFTSCNLIDISSKSSGKKIYSADASAFRIYIPVAQHTDLTAEDRSYLSSLGLNADDNSTAYLR